MELRILGPLDVRVDGRSVPIRGAISRLILTLLIARRGTTVSSDVLAEVVWGPKQPGNPTNALHTQISHLRRDLRPLVSVAGTVVVTVPGGYRLDVPPAVIDAERFEDAVVVARGLSRSTVTAELVQAEGLLSSALELWRGEPLADGADHPYLAADVARLRELRVTALEARGYVLLALGRHAELVPDAQLAVAGDSLHEPLHAQLALALYRCGRQGEALRAIAEARRLLVEEVGVDPGAELRLLEQQVLVHAPELDWAPPVDEALGPVPNPPRAEQETNVGRPPPLGSHHRPRPRLDALLEEATEVPLMIVAAPAGAGKTAAVAGWLTRRVGRGAWLALEPDSNDPAAFWSAVAAALGLRRASEIRTGRALMAALDTAARAHRDIAPPDVVVIDDYHLVTNPAIHAELDDWLNGSSGVHLVISTRHDPPLRLASLRAHGQLREIRFDDLRFTDDEVDAFLEDLVGLRLVPQDVRRLVERTEGWAVGIQLAAVSLRHHDDTSAFLRQFAGDDRHVADYLRDDVLSRVEERLRRFLFDTAILDRLHAGLCAAVTGDHDSGRHLEELERLNLFLLPLDHRRQWYRYHPLFAEWLRLQPPADVDQLHRRAGRWLAEHNLAADAIRHFIAAADGEAAAELIERERWVLVGQGRQHTLRDWIQLLPAYALRTRPRLILAAAWVAYDAGHWDDVESLVELIDAEQLATEPDAGLLRAELSLLSAGRLAAVGRAPEAGAMAAEALRLIPEDEPRARSGLLLVLGKSRLAAGDLAGARRTFIDAERLAEPYHLAIVQVIARAHLGEIQRHEGSAQEAERSARQALAIAACAELGEHPECAVAHLTLANVLIDEGRLADAEVALQRGGDLAELIPYAPRQGLLGETRQRFRSAAAPPAAGVPGERLTAKERAVLRLLPTELTPRQMAAEMYISLNTIKSHTRTLYRKLGVNTRHEAIEQARRRDLL